MQNAGIRARRIAVAALTYLGVTAAVAPSAFAGTATLDVASGTVAFNADPGEFNTVDIFISGSRVKVRDVDNLVTAGTGCTVDDPNQADCGPVAAVTAINANLLDEDDQIDASNFAVAETFNLGEGDDGPVETGDGNDTVNGEGGRDTNISLGDGNDTFNGGPGADAARGNDGDDTLNGDAGDDNLLGDGGNDVINGGAGDEVAISGGEGNDTLHGDGGNDNLAGDEGDDSLSGDDGADVLSGGFSGDGNDTLNGGADLDTADYSDRGNGVSVSADDVANDGNGGETDNVAADVERINGGEGDDTLTATAGTAVVARQAAAGVPQGTELDGNAGDDVLNGGAGSEVLHGGTGDDTLNGNDGADSLFGEAGNDVQNGGNGDDYARDGQGRDTYNGGDGVDEVDFGFADGPVQINPNGQPVSGQANEGDTVAADVENYTGSAFNDLIVGSAAPNLIQAGDGNDQILSRDAVSDNVICGRGSDFVAADGLDITTADGDSLCEKVDRGSLAGVLGRQKFGSITTTLSASAKSLTVPFRCGQNIQGGCSGVITIVTGGSTARAAKTVGKASFITPAATRINVKVPLSKSSRKTLHKKKKLKVTISLKVQDGRGATGSAKKTVTLKLKRKSKKK